VVTFSNTLHNFFCTFHGNYRPRLSGVSNAIRRRLHLLPFRHKPAKVDRYLIDKFRATFPGIMAMAVEGCLHYQRMGLAPPRIVTDAAEEYVVLEDQMLQWLEERCDRWGAERDLHRDFARFMQGRGFVPSEQVFVARLEGIDGLQRSQKLPNGKCGLWGIALRGHQSEWQLDRGPSVMGDRSKGLISFALGGVGRGFRLSSLARPRAGAPVLSYD
jgi:hypothetical protein